MVTLPCKDANWLLPVAVRGCVPSISFAGIVRTIDQVLVDRARSTTRLQYLRR